MEISFLDGNEESISIPKEYEDNLENVVTSSV